MRIGCVTEIKKHEYRVGMTPVNAAEYVANGHEIVVQAGLGEGSSFPDAEYEAAGAKVLANAAEVWRTADMIVKVKEPLKDEYGLMREGQILYTYLHLAADPELTSALLGSGATGIAYETLTDRNGGLPLLTPMSEVAGRLSVLEGAKCLEKPFGGRGVLLAGVPGTPRAKVVVIGAGVVGTNACKIAVGFGARVVVMDINLDRLRYLDDVFGSQIQTLYSSESAIRQEIADADLVVGAVLIPGKSAPKLIKREYLKLMHPGSVIVDVAVDQGGCSEVTRATYHDAPTFVVDGVVNYCVANMPGSTPRTSTVALTNATLKYGLMIANHGLKEACTRDAGIKNAINVLDGRCTHPNVAFSLDLPYETVDMVESRRAVTV